MVRYGMALYGLMQWKPRVLPPPPLSPYLTWVDLISPDLMWAHLTWSELTCPDLTYPSLISPDLIWSHLAWSDLIWLDLIWLDVIWSDLIWSDPMWVNLTWLTWSDQTWSDLIWVDLTWSHQSWLDLTWLDLIWFGLTWCDLIWVYLTWRNLTWLFPAFSWCNPDQITWRARPSLLLARLASIYSRRESTRGEQREHTASPLVYLAVPPNTVFFSCLGCHGHAHIGGIDCLVSFLFMFLIFLHIVS